MLKTGLSAALALVLITACGSPSASLPLMSSPASRPSPTIGPSPGLISQAGVAFDPAIGKTVVFGGLYPQSGASRDTWLWDGESWSQAPTSSSPPISTFPSMTYDRRLSKMVLFSGESADLSSSTWTWSGAAWQRELTASPTLPGVPMAYDGALQRDILVDYQGRTWAFDGSHWTQLQTEHHPDVTGNPGSLVYDYSRQLLVFFGHTAPVGPPPWPTQPATVWTFNGVDWSSVTVPAGPDPINLVGMVYVPDGYVLALVDVERVVQTWRLDPSGWRHLTTQSPPPSMPLPAFAYDPSHHCAVLFGRVTKSKVMQSQTWLWDGTDWYLAAISEP